MTFDYLIQRNHVGKGRQSKNDIIRGLRCRWSQYGHGGDDAKGPLSADEELLEVVSCRVSIDKKMYLKKWSYLCCPCEEWTIDLVWFRLGVRLRDRGQCHEGNRI